MGDYNVYISPFVERFATREMIELWSPQRKFSTWRRCWLALAEAEKELGLDITDEQIEELRAHLDDIDFAKAREYEEKTRHDVMAHILAYGDVAPKAKPIIHLGATSCYVTDNTDLILMREGLIIIRNKIVAVLRRLKEFALKYKDLATLGYTHFQSAQLVTVGKRACLWAQDLVLDLQQIEYILANIKCRGVKGATGTQASFLTLFNGDHEKVKMLDELVAKKLGFNSSIPITGQTYTRKIDTQIIQALSGIGESVHKFATDMRLLQHLKEVEEPFEKSQVGSSAMPYKRNPMRAERACSLARFVMYLPVYTVSTTAVQWMERTLDDSAIRRVVIPEGFLATDAVLNLYLNIMENPVVYPEVIRKHVKEELPFMATEILLMAGVKKGGDRQKLHEIIRRHAQDAGDRVKREGKDNDLLTRLANDQEFPLSLEEIEDCLDEKNFVGRAPEQVEEFVADILNPIIEKYQSATSISSSVKV
ncbi:MAG: adenylosuccinate lyase [Candidatus Hydrogenedentes bacterium]|nr:adenylosuccinate lyase [Candidatus Hydrogenedentota bacterium]